MNFRTALPQEAGRRPSARLQNKQSSSSSVVRALSDQSKSLPEKFEKLSGYPGYISDARGWRRPMVAKSSPSKQTQPCLHLIQSKFWSEKSKK